MIRDKEISSVLAMCRYSAHTSLSKSFNSYRYGYTIEPSSSSPIPIYPLKQFI